MARILFGVIPALGHIFPTIAIAQRLQDEGHEVAYACHPSMAFVLERAGLKLLDGFCWGDRMVELQEVQRTKHNRWMVIPRSIQRRPVNIWFHSLDEGTAQLITLLRSWQPDVLVCDLSFQPGPIAAEACELPYASSCPMVLPLRSVALPPYGLGFSPRTGPTWRRRLIDAGVQRIMCMGDKVVNRVRQRYHLPSVSCTFFYPSPYLFLAYTTEAFEYARPDLPPQVYFVGPCISRRRGDGMVDFPWEWLDERPTVYVSLGTVNTGRIRFFEKVIAASEGQPWQTVISVGSQAGRAQWATVPQNVLLHDYVPQLELLQRVRAVISHGGNNTVTEALAAGVPLAVAPLMHDQPEAAQRVVEAGVGLRMNFRTVKVRELRDSMRRLLEEPAFRENAQRIAEDFARCDGPGTSAALILRLAEKRMPLVRSPDRRPTVYAGRETELFSAAGENKATL